MRAQIFINRFGTTQAATGKRPPYGGIVAHRSNRFFSIILDDMATIPALINLIRTLRAVESDIILNGASTKPLTRQQMCLLLARRALSMIEKQNEDMFMSDMEIFNPRISTIDVLPENLTRLLQLDFGGLDAPSALMLASSAKIKNLVSVGQSQSMRLYYLALPADITWPQEPPPLSKPLEEALSDPLCTWLSITYEAALAIRAPIYQHGILRLNAELRLPFQRVLNPIIPKNERPAHFRVLTSAYAIGEEGQDSAVII
jgi:hypothetical protein